MITRSADHRYTFEGSTYPGVTSILRIIDKSDALVAWASRMTAEAAIGLLPLLPSMMANVGAEGVTRALTARSSWKRDEAAALGTDIHAMADQIHRGVELPDMPEATKLRVDHYLKWWDASGWTIRATEALLVNTEDGYGGTLDLLARDRDGRTVLADVKTGKAIYKEVALQLAAYGNAMYVQFDDQLYTMPAIDRYCVLHVTAEGVREVELAIGDLERNAFRAAMVLSAWRDSMKGKL